MGGMILITLGEMTVNHLYPLAVGTDKYDAESLSKAMTALPPAAFALLLVNNMICSFFAGIICTLVSMRIASRPALVVGIVLALAGIYKIINLWHPIWFSILDPLIYLPFVWVGYLLVRKKPAPEPATV